MWEASRAKEVAEAVSRSEWEEVTLLELNVPLMSARESPRLESVFSLVLMTVNAADWASSRPCCRCSSRIGAASNSRSRATASLFDRPRRIDSPGKPDRMRQR